MTHTQSQPRLTNEQRQTLMDRVSQRLNDQDDETLVLMADLAQGTFSVQAASAPGRPFTTRRGFLTAALMGGFVAATAGAVAVWEYGAGRGRELGSDLDQAKRELAQAKQDIARLWGLVRLHEKLDETGLEQVVLSGMAAFGAGLGALAGAVEAVQTGIKAVQDGLIKLDTVLPTIRASLAWLEGLIGDLDRRVHLLEDAIGRAVNQVSPITQALDDVWKSILAVLPPVTSARIKEVLDRVGEIVTFIPRATGDINLKVLTPFRTGWLPEGPSGLTGWLIEPFNAKLLGPLQALLGQWSELARRWESDLTVPAKAAINRRDAIRQEIADYRSQHRLQEPPGA